MIRSAILCVALACAASPAAAAVQLDQEAVTVVAAGNAPVMALIGQVPAPPSRPGPSTFNAAVQTFTAGLSGTLSHLEFQAANFGPTTWDGILQMALVDGDYEAGARSIVWSEEVPFSSLASTSLARQGVLSAFFNVIDAGYRVTIGQRYSVLFYGLPFAPDQHAALVIGQGAVPGPTPPVFSGPGYAGGRFMGLHLNGTPIQSARDYDVGFRSFVDVADAVPEPATWASMILGLGMLGAAARHRRAQRRGGVAA